MLPRLYQKISSLCTTQFITPITSLARTYHVGDSKPDKPRFLRYNDFVYPPTPPGETPRPAFVCHQSLNLKYSKKKMWYIACFVRGMTVDEALRQLKFVRRKGAAMAMKTIAEARTLAITEHNVEFPTNLWVAESFVTKGICIKGIRRHARKRMGEIRYGYVHYNVRLEEGKPPEHYYQIGPRTPKEKLDLWFEKMRKRKIFISI